MCIELVLFSIELKTKPNKTKTTTLTNLTGNWERQCWLLYFYLYNIKAQWRSQIRNSLKVCTNCNFKQETENKIMVQYSKVDLT